MIYAFYGNEPFLINKEINKIIKDNNISDFNISNYDLSEFSLQDIIDDALTVSLFDEKKAIVVNNAYIFTGTTIKKDKEDNLDTLLEYFEHINPDTVIIFISNSEKLDERKKIVKALHKCATIKEFSKNANPNNIVKEWLKDYQIDYKDINLLIDRVGTNLGILEQEVEKIKIYKDQDKKITKEDILNTTTKNIDVDIFELINKIVEHDTEHAIEIYYEMLKRNEEPIKILIILANQFRIMYQAKELYSKGYSGNDIAKILDIHPYRIKLALEKNYNYSSKKLLSYLEALANLDYSIKTGMIDASLGLELFIMEGNV